MCGSGSVFQIRIRIQEAPEYGGMNDDRNSMTGMNDDKKSMTGMNDDKNSITGMLGLEFSQLYSSP